MTRVRYNIADLEWKVLYVGSAHDSTRDQTLDEILVGPIPVGINKFVLQADAPDPSRLPCDEILGVTVVLVTCSFREREFVRVGYYVNNEYIDPDRPPPQVKLNEDGTPQPAEIPKPPKWPELDLSKVQRQILADKPRVTKFPIPWGDEQQQQQQQQNNNNNNNNQTTMIGEDEQVDNNNEMMETEEKQQQFFPPTAGVPATATMDADTEMQQ